MSDIFSILSPQARKELKKTEQPLWISPMLATLTDKYFSDPQWLYEHKWDGERILAYKSGSGVRLLTRNQKIANAAYPDIVSALEKQTLNNYILDGEVIALKNNKSNFELLQTRMHDTKAIKRDKNISIVYYLFDLLYLNGYDTRDLALIDRKALLEHALVFNYPILYTEHKVKNGLEYYDFACKQHWEGVIAKDMQSTYVSVRSKSWLKFKCINQQEFVIGGFTDPQGSRAYFGALLIGYYKNNTLMYAGKVGTGFNEEILTTLGSKLYEIEQQECPFSNKEDIQHKNVHWVKPILVAEVAFSEWTNANRLRHPRYRGLRRDKNAHDVIQEKPERIS